VDFQKTELGVHSGVREKMGGLPSAVIERGGRAGSKDRARRASGRMHSSGTTNRGKGLGERGSE